MKPEWGNERQPTSRAVELPEHKQGGRTPVGEDERRSGGRELPVGEDECQSRGSWEGNRRNGEREPSSVKVWEAWRKIGEERESVKSIENKVVIVTAHDYPWPIRIEDDCLVVASPLGRPAFVMGLVFHPLEKKLMTKAATLIDRLESCVRQQALLLRSRRQHCKSQQSDTMEKDEEVSQDYKKEAVTMAKVAVLLFLVIIACAGDLVSCNQTYIMHMNPDCRPMVHPTHADYSYAILDLYPDPVYELHTTRSPQFLRLTLDADAASSTTALPRPIQAVEAASHDVFIVVLNTARRRPELRKGFRATTVTARDGIVLGKPKEYDSPWDQYGHETNTTSTAAGSTVANASFLGYAVEIARSMAIDARVTAYKVCGASGCFGSDILTRMEVAIFDDANILSLSLSGGSAPYKK
ncbi:subtilisin-like protease SBT1.8 [Canna indica]|uniref:Subtilisin-like protease SBT1.8 n=1 Tax=Canna indica TaxID=4628 RepID=A0AAQ3K2J0_9LILI|nr:subtilisin-like protease SBT1.8 [Canna indica]